MDHFFDQDPTIPPPPTTQELLTILHNRISQLEGATPVRFDKEPKISGPSPFSGRKDEAMEFLLKCDNVFDVQPRSYATTKSRIAYVTNLLKDEAYRWVMPHLSLPIDEQPLWAKDWPAFKEEFKRVFGDSNIIESSRLKLKYLRQTGACTTYATEFQRHAAYLHWGDEALRHHFFDGLKEDVKDKLLTPNHSATIQDLVHKAIEWDDLLFQRRKSHDRQPNPQSGATKTRSNPTMQTRTVQTTIPITTTTTPGATPMDIDGVRTKYGPITPEERQRRKNENLCFYCAKPGHLSRDCRARPNKGATTQVNAVDTTKNSEPQS